MLQVILQIMNKLLFRRIITVILQIMNELLFSKLN